MTFKTPDLCDQFEADLGTSVRVVAPMFRRYGGRNAFSGRIATLKLFEDNSLVRTAFGEDGRARCWSSTAAARCAARWSGPARHPGAENGWEGVVVYGCIRDSGDINGIDIGVRALDTHPQKSIKKNVGDRDIAVTFGGVTFQPGRVPLR